MQRYPQRPRVDGAFVAVDPFKPSVSLGIKNIITGQNDPTIDDIPVKPQQQYAIPYEGQPYVQPGMYLPQPYSQPIYVTQPPSQPIYQHRRPLTQPISQPVYPYPPNFRPPYPTQPPVIVSQPPVVPAPFIAPSKGSSSESSRRSRRAESRRPSQSRSPRRSPIRRRSRSSRRNERQYSRSPQRPWLSRFWRGRRHRVHTGTHQPRRDSDRVDSAPSASEVRGRSRSPKPLGAKEPGEIESASGDGSSFRSVSRSRPLASVLPVPPVVTPTILPHFSPPPAREQRPRSPRFSLTSPRFSPTSPRFSPIPPRHPSNSPHRSRTSTRYCYSAPSHEPPAVPPPASQGSTRSSASRSRSRSPRKYPLDYRARPASGSRRSRSPPSPPVSIRRPPTVIIPPPAVRPAWRQRSRSQLYHDRRSRRSSPPRQARRHSRSHSRSERRSSRRRYSWDEPQNKRDYRERLPPVVILPEPEFRRPHWDTRSRRQYRRSRSRSSSSSSPSRRRRRRSRSQPILVPVDTYNAPFVPPGSRPHTPMYTPPTTDGYKPQPYVVVQPLAGEDKEEYYPNYAVQPRITAYATAFLLDTVPRQIYLHFMLRLPSLYFSRVTRIFEEAEMSMPEIKKMALEAASGWKDPVRDINRGFNFEPQELTPPYASLQSSWQSFIDSLMREWKTLNIISVLLLSAILTILQIDVAAADPYTRYSALLSLVCALMSLLYGCIYIIRFGTMRKTYKAAEWATEAQKTRTGIWWNVWVMLAMPATWLAWSMILYIFCIMSFVWRTGTSEDVNIHAISPRDALGPRIAITVVFSLGLIYFLLIVSTFRRYGDMMDRAWQQRVLGWAQEKLGYVYAPPPRPYRPSYADKPRSYEPTTRYPTSFAQHPVQTASFGAYPSYPQAPPRSSPPRDPENPTVNQRRSLSKPGAHKPSSPYLDSSFLAQVAPPLSSLLHISPKRTRSPSLSPTRLRGTSNRRAAPSRSPSQDKKRSKSELGEQRLSPILADIVPPPIFAHSRSRSRSQSIARTSRLRSRSPALSQPPPATDKDVQTLKILSISTEGVFRWNEPRQLFTRGLNYADWARFNYESTAGWHDKIDTLRDPERFAVGSDSPQRRLAQVLDWWNVNFFRELDAEAILGEESADSNATATFAVYLVIDGPCPLTDIATCLRGLPKGLERIYLYRINQISDLEAVNLRDDLLDGEP